jgi:hypothetical protein
MAAEMATPERASHPAPLGQPSLEQRGTLGHPAAFVKGPSGLWTMTVTSAIHVEP